MDKLEAQAGLIFSVNALTKILLSELESRNIHYKLNNKVKISVTAALEYVLAEILELSGNCCRDNKRIRITPDHIMKAINNDDDLKLVFDTNIIKVQNETPKFKVSSHKILTQVHPDTNITNQGSRYIDAVIHTFIQLCANEFPIDDKKIDVLKMMDNILVGDLAKFSKSEIGKSIVKYENKT